MAELAAYVTQLDEDETAERMNELQSLLFHQPLVSEGPTSHHHNPSHHRHHHHHRRRRHQPAGRKRQSQPPPAAALTAATPSSPPLPSPASSSLSSGGQVRDNIREQEGEADNSDYSSSSSSCPSSPSLSPDGSPPSQTASCAPNQQERASLDMVVNGQNLPTDHLQSIDMTGLSSLPSPPPPPPPPPPPGPADDACSSLLASIRPSADASYLQGCISDLSVALRASELQRRHLHLTNQALINEQTRLQQQVQSLAQRERELEEHCVLLGAKDERSLAMLRGQLLEAARAESHKARKAAQALGRAKDVAEAKAQVIVHEAQARGTALEAEVARLTSLLAQRAVLASAQARQWEERDKVRENQVEEARALVAEIAVLKEQLERVEDRRANEVAGKMEAMKKAEEEAEAARWLQRKLEETEILVHEAQQRIRELTARLEATSGGEEEERFAMEVDRMHKGFASEKRRMEGEIESLRRALDEARSQVAPDRPGIRDFIEDDEEDEDIAARTSTSEESPGAGPPPQSQPSQQPWGEMEVELVRHLVEERLHVVCAGWQTKEEAFRHRLARMEAVCRSLASMRLAEKRRREEDLARLTEGFREELRQVLSGAREAFDQEKAADMAQAALQWENEAAKRVGEVEERLRTAEAEVQKEKGHWVMWQELLIEGTRHLQGEQGDLRSVLRLLDEKGGASSDGFASTLRSMLEEIARRWESIIDQINLVRQRLKDEQVLDLGGESEVPNSPFTAGLRSMISEISSWLESRHISRVDELTRQLEDGQDIRLILSMAEQRANPSVFDLSIISLLTKVVSFGEKLKAEALEVARCKLEDEVGNSRVVNVREESTCHDSVLALQRAEWEEEKNAAIKIERKRLAQAFQEQIQRLLSEARESLMREKEQALTELRHEEEQQRWSLTVEYERERASLLARIAELNAYAQIQDDGSRVSGSPGQHEMALQVLREELEKAFEIEKERAIEAVREEGERRWLQERMEMEAVLRSEGERLQVLKKEMQVEVARALQELREAEGREARLKVEKEEVVQALRDKQGTGIYGERAFQLVKEEMQLEMDREVNAIREKVEGEAEARINEMKRKQEEGREALLRTAETEWRAKLTDIANKTKTLQSALVKIGAKVKDQEHTIASLQSQLQERSQAFEGAKQRIKEKDKKVEALERRVREEEDKRRRWRHEGHQLEQQERLRLELQHEKELALTVERMRKEFDQEMESVVSSLKKRYAKKLAKMQQLWASEKEVLLATVSHKAAAAAAVPLPPAFPASSAVAFNPVSPTFIEGSANDAANRQAKLHHLMQARFLDY